MSAPVLDLLRERRRELDLVPLSGVLQERPRLVRRGTLVGAGLIGVVALISLLLLLQRQWLRAQIRPLEPYEAQANSLRARLARRKARLEATEATNKRLVDGLTNVRSSSALLADLQLRTPDGVQIRAAADRGPSLSLKGHSRDPLALERINALQLELQGSPLLKPGSMALGRLERGGAGGGGARPATTGPQPVAFEMTGPFSELDPNRQLEVLQALGSRGMARRLELLRREGLLP